MDLVWVLKVRWTSELQKKNWFVLLFKRLAGFVLFLVVHLRDKNKNNRIQQPLAVDNVSQNPIKHLFDLKLIIISFVKICRKHWILCNRLNTFRYSMDVLGTSFSTLSNRTFSYCSEFLLLVATFYSGPRLNCQKQLGKIIAVAQFHTPLPHFQRPTWRFHVIGWLICKGSVQIKLR